jgi:hypothetical protein
VPNREQSVTVCSSVDPWHAETNLTEASGDQVGFDLFFTSGITRGLPTMIPVAVLYSTPEDAAAQISYIKTRGYPISYIEMGEEADGQHMLPEDYAALYIQFAAAIHKVDPNGPRTHAYRRNRTIRSSHTRRYLAGVIQDASRSVTVPP